MATNQPSSHLYVRSRGDRAAFALRLAFLAITVIRAGFWPGPWARAAEPVSVLYAGSLLNVMERDLGPAFTKATGEEFRGYGGGSNALANQIKGKLRRGDLFISANPKVDGSLIGEGNGDWVRWYVTFAQSPLVIGYSDKSRFAADFQHKPWRQVLAEPGIRIGRTDPKLDPKGALTLELMKRAESIYQAPGLAHTVLGDPDNPAQILPEETLVGRLQSGQLDVGFFYSTETVDAKIAHIDLAPEIALGAVYTVAILRDSSNPLGADHFVAFLLGRAGQKIMKVHGLVLVKPTLEGSPATVPPDLQRFLTLSR